MNAIDPTTPIAVTMQAQEWNQVLTLLGKAPYEVIAPIMQKMGDQVLTAAGQRPATPPPLVNGSAAHVSD